MVLLPRTYALGSDVAAMYADLSYVVDVSIIWSFALCGQIIVLAVVGPIVLEYDFDMLYPVAVVDTSNESAAPAIDVVPPSFCPGQTKKPLALKLSLSPSAIAVQQKNNESKRTHAVLENKIPTLPPAN